MSPMLPTVRQLTPGPKLPAAVRTMFLVALLVAAFGTIASMLASSASAATSARQIVTEQDSFVFINDDESWPLSDEKATFNLSNKGFGIVAPSHRIETRGESSYCAGDEVRAAYQVRSQLDSTSPGWVYVTMSAQLYEGASCATTDLDGSGSISFWMAPGQSLGKTLVVKNTAEGGDDFIQLHLKLKNADV